MLSDDEALEFITRMPEINKALDDLLFESDEEEGIAFGRAMYAALERVRSEEREACARVCEELVIANAGRADLTADQCAAAIRARKEKE